MLIRRSSIGPGLNISIEVNFKHIAYIYCNFRSYIMAVLIAEFDLDVSILSRFSLSLSLSLSLMQKNLAITSLKTLPKLMVAESLLVSSSVPWCRVHSAHSLDNQIKIVSCSLNLQPCKLIVTLKACPIFNWTM